MPGIRLVHWNAADVRGAGLDSGLVDYKICANDATRSGLLLRCRR